MDIQSKELDGAFQLYPMIIPGWRDSVLPAGIAHGGIPQSIYQQPKGLLMVIDPQTTLSQAMAAYDSVVVWLNDEETSVGTIIQPGAEGDRIALYLPPGLLVNGINQLFYRWKRSSGNSEDSRPILDVLYHNPAPGFPAPAGITLIHPVSVGPTEAAQGALINFRVSYPRAFDKVTLTVGTWSRTITVTDPTQPITLTLTAADFRQIGDNPLTPVSARVVDQLGNGNSSATTFMDIHASQVLLEQAIFREILDENNDDPNYVDLEKMNTGPLWALVHLIGAVWEAKDQIRLKFTAELGGKEIVSHEETLEVTQIPSQFSWRIENAMVIPDSEVSVVYEQLRGGRVIGVSQEAKAKVIGSALQLPKPDIKEANGDSLNPIAAKNTLIAIVPEYADMIGTLLSVKFLGTDGGGSHTTLAVPVTNQGRQEVNLPKSLIPFNLGKSVTVTYTVTRNGVPQTSKPFILVILFFSKTDLEAPVIPQSSNDQLDLSTFSTHAWITSYAWPLIAEGQKVWLRVYCVDENGDLRVLPLLTGHSVRASEMVSGLKVELSRSELDRLRNRSDLRVELKVTFDGDVHESAAVEFPGLTVLLLAELVELFEDFNSFTQAVTYGVGATVTTPLGIFKMLTSTTSPIGQNYATQIWVDALNGVADLHGLWWYHWDSDRAELSLAYACEKISFVLLVNTPAVISVRCFDMGGGLVENSSFGVGFNLVEFAGNNIKRIEFAVAVPGRKSGLSMLDDIKLFIKRSL